MQGISRLSPKIGTECGNAAKLFSPDERYFLASLLFRHIHHSHQIDPGSALGGSQPLQDQRTETRFQQSSIPVNLPA
ncbi:hypothetical protein EG68_06598 [Paragonimus skrjabini miyazakii]|uniref:Uncharacterized protein n=1 Tax=Paragonimus skrjabini miyazakii TaxID=59628 RepID=A0A8S9Z1W4_9TREM|nr:hypothetical protein EG68_06598 [Paragonimus skrjabini miyazakii]